jgi:hypothetical protein
VHLLFSDTDAATPDPAALAKVIGTVLAGVTAGG